MLICDTHADTLWAMATGKPRLDLTPDMLTNPADTRHGPAAHHRGAGAGGL